MFYLGIALAVGAALAFVVVGALTLFGGENTTTEQILPGFKPDNPSALERALTFAGLWIPILVITAFCLLAGVRILRVVFTAL